MYKPFGWEVLDLRYGGLIARLETMHQRQVARSLASRNSSLILKVTGSSPTLTPMTRR